MKWIPRKLLFRSAYFEAFTRGYLSESSQFLTLPEKENLVYSCRYMVWEQTIRFLSDYLNGDTYYKISYPEHNRVRTLSQLRYLEVLEENAGAMEKCVRQIICRDVHEWRLCTEFNNLIPI